MNLKPNPYPFTMEHSFKLAIAVGEKDFKIAAQGQIIASFPFREGSLEIFKQIAAYQVSAGKGLKIEVHAVDHFAIAANCDGFESFTKK